MQKENTDLYTIEVFGSATVRVEPDVAVINFQVSHRDEHPRNAYQRTRKLAQQVQRYLATTPIDDVSASQLHLAPAYKYLGPERQFIGYLVELKFRVILRDMKLLEEILTGLIDAGVSEIKRVELQTSRLKELRASARQNAVKAGFEKADLYCETSGIQRGKVVRIEDVNPDQIRGSEGHNFIQPEAEPDDLSELQAFSPGSISVNGAVRITFAIEA